MSGYWSGFESLLCFVEVCHSVERAMSTSSVLQEVGG